MPGMDGMAVVQRVRQLSQEKWSLLLLHCCYFRLRRSSHGRSQPAAGADDYLLKNSAGGQLLVRLATAQRIVELEDKQIEQQRSLQDALHELRQANQQMRWDLARAAELQREQLPDMHGTVDQTLYAAVYEPCASLGAIISAWCRLTRIKRWCFCLMPLAMASLPRC